MATATPTTTERGTGALTIVVPTYNGMATLGATLHSIATQSCQNFDLLFIDDGSTDGTARLIERMLRPNDRLIRKENSGLYDTLNHALAEVASEWVALLFQDDLLKPSYVGECLALINQRNEADFIWFAIDTVDDSGNLICGGIDVGRREVIQPGVKPWQDALLAGTFWTISGSLSRTWSLRQLSFRADLPHCADYELLLRALRDHTFLYVEAPLVQIRQHEGQASAKNLREASDIQERLLILRESLKRHPGDLDAELCKKIARRMVLQVMRRSAGYARRARLRASFLVLRHVPPAMRLARPIP